MQESRILRRIVLACSRGAVRLFRNNCGQYRTDAGMVVRYGVCNPGGSDLIGWRTVTITPDMVGERVAVFAAIEVKAAKGVVSAAQLTFLDVVSNAGGIAGVARTEDEALQILEGYCGRKSSASKTTQAGGETRGRINGCGDAD